MTEQKTLLHLYQLLWEQIKDKYIHSLTHETGLMVESKLITTQEESILDDSILRNLLKGTKTSDNKKQFVQRMIETLTKEQSI